MKQSFYNGACIILTTKHAKSIAIAPPFLEILGASVIEYVVDTDELGTFSGEVEREGNALECVRKKCEWSFNKLGNKIDYALASEGSFGPHPFIPFVPCNQEILYFIDRKRDFHLHLSLVSEKTNYRTEKTTSLEQIYRFAEQVSFPSHALIIRPDKRETKSPIFKGLSTPEDLEEAFRECIKHSKESIVWVETDMRAQFNPSRMKVIAELAKKLAHRLNTQCGACQHPGWGKIKYEKGLICKGCGSPTECIKSEVFGCVKCGYEERREPEDGEKKADPKNCFYCNP
jgi:hypothetical protein